MFDLMNISNNDWSKLNVTILGAARSGLAAAILAKFIGLKAFVSDSNNTEHIQNNIKKFFDIYRQKSGSSADNDVVFNYELGGHTNKIYDADFVILSPGISDESQIVKKIIDKNILVISEIEFAFWFTKSDILAITGSNGKTTSVSLLHEMVLESGSTSLLGGNVGTAFSENVFYELVDQIQNPTHVLELSSFQLENILQFAPKIAAILNITEDHMDRYREISSYLKAKLNIVRNLPETGYCVYNEESDLLNNYFKGIKRSIPFSLSGSKNGFFKLKDNTVLKCDNQPLFTIDDIHLKGKHNIENIIAAATVAKLYGIDDQSITKAVKKFKPVTHRIEYVTEIDDVQFYNDSKATNVASAAAGISTFRNNIILILGGQDKGDTDFTVLNRHLKNRVKSIIAYGNAGMKIHDQLEKYFAIEFVEKFHDCVLAAWSIALPGDTILLSPACASFDQFENYERRGEQFKKYVKNLRK